jgi:hypothetical protein
MAYYKRWPQWWGLKEDNDLSIIDVVNSGAIDFKLAGLLWLLMEHRTSLLVAAGPSFAGKSTLLHALLDFLPAGIEKVTLRGYEEDFKLIGSGQPDKTYLITEEISNHSYEYLWGRQVVKALEFIPKGYALGGTIHARNIKEVAYVLQALGAPLPLIAGIGLVITLQVRYLYSYGGDPVRYVDTVSTISHTREGLVAQLLAARQSVDDRFAYPAGQALNNILNDRFAIKYHDISSRIELRGSFLNQIHDKGITSRTEVRNAILEYYKNQS